MAIDKSTQIEEILALVKRSSLERPAIIVTPETQAALVDKLTTKGNLYIILEGYRIKVFVTQNCAVGAIYFGSENQMFNLLMRLQDGANAGQPF